MESSDSKFPQTSNHLDHVEYVNLCDIGLKCSAVNKIVVAKFDFEAIKSGEPPIKKDDRMVILDDTKYPYLFVVRKLSTNEQCLVPRNYVCTECKIQAERWYFKNVSRAQAEELLLNSSTPCGTFLIRESKKEHSLSIKDCDQSGFTVQHYKIFNDDGGYFISSDCRFASLNTLTEAYSRNPMGLCHKLTTVCPKSKPALSEPISSLTTTGVGDKSYLPVIQQEYEWEINREEVKLIKELGSGKITAVWLGTWKNKEVTAKIIKPSSSPQTFLHEVAMMKKLQHKNLISLHAVCLTSNPMVIVREFVKHGTLYDYLHTEEGMKLELSTLFSIATQIASGLQWLEQHRMIHRTIMARHCLIGEDNVMKISNISYVVELPDGVDEYIEKAGALFPFKWTALEVLKVNRYKSQSVVWSYGILLMELLTVAKRPYPNMSNKDVLPALTSGYRMPKPPELPEGAYKLILRCWDANPILRPSFKELVSSFELLTAVYNTQRRSNAPLPHVISQMVDGEGYMMRNTTLKTPPRNTNRLLY